MTFAKVLAGTRHFENTGFEALTATTFQLLMHQDALSLSRHSGPFFSTYFFTI
jgi:hypothetical protein